VSFSYYTKIPKISSPKNFCDIIFQKGQIHFRGFALFVLMIYVLRMNWLQVVLMARYSKTQNALLMKNIAVMMLVTHLQFIEMHDSGKVSSP